MHSAVGVGEGGEGFGEWVAVGEAGGAEGEAEALGFRVPVARGADELALAVAECELDADGEVVAGSVASVAAPAPGTVGDGLAVPLAPAEPVRPACRSAVGGAEEWSASAPAPAITAIAAAASTNAQRPRLDLLLRRCRRRAVERPAPRGGGGVPYADSDVRSESARSACSPDSAVAPATGSPMGRPHPGQFRAPLRWRLQEEQ
ncbi:hypothetical protein ACEZDB_00920 [Streptacidiphilus sp. N1-3]|uniref:Uncharacterized protein n=1 Tax=Streptacidiphilus alkalitolerans TaxID=3342712 RepID=A0ABV6WTY8_9ACTN